MARTKQTRKGKKAWRKNVDVEDVHDALDQKREKEILLGTEEDFVIDTEGDRKTKKQKVLKTTEILTNKSKVPALGERLPKKLVLKKRANQLMTLSGRLLTGNKFKATVDRTGILRAETADLWTEFAPEAPIVPVISPSQPSVPNAAPSKAPATLSQAPLQLSSKTARSISDFEDGGKSYNPALEDWKKLIDHEFGNESNLEVKRQAMEEHQKRIEYLIETLEDNEVEDLDEVNMEDGDHEENDDDKYKLSVNPRTEIKIKTRTQRNKEEKIKKAQELNAKLRELKRQIADLSRLDEIETQVEEKLGNKKASLEKKFYRHGRHDVSFKPIEVKLSDELTGNLRSLRPEGNLLYDQMFKLQMQGKVAAGLLASKKRKYKQRFVEKRSFRDP